MFTDFQTAPEASDGFADFQAAAPSMNAPHGHENKVPPVNDKLHALKALVSDKNLYTAKPAEEKLDGEQPERTEEEEWAEFSSSSSSKEPGNKYDAAFNAGTSQETPHSVFSASPADKDEKLLSWGSGEPSAGLTTQSQGDPSGESGGGGWADFSSAPAPAASSTIDWSGAVKSAPKPEPEESDFAKYESSVPPAVSSQKPSTKETTTAAAAKPKDLNAKDKGLRPGNKRYDYFGRSFAPASNLGLAALDTAPPEFPPDDDDDDDDGDDFDKFGTFQSNQQHPGTAGQTGVSSLVTAYGGLEDFGESNNVSSHHSYVSKRVVGNGPDLGYSFKSKMASLDGTRDNMDALSTSSSEFSGWKSKQDTARDDSQSVASLELNKKSSKDGSPAGGDSQSVSSLDMGTSDSGRKSTTPQDARSINSLDFKTSDDPQVKNYVV